MTENGGDTDETASSQHAEPGHAMVGRVRYQMTFVVLAVAVLSYSLLQTLALPVLPLLQRNLHTDQSTVAWILTVYLLSAAVATPIIGRVGDMVGKKKVLVIILVVLAAGSIMAALATSIYLMIIGRAVQGLGSGVIPLSFGIIRDEFPSEKVSGAVGVIAACLAVGGGVGLVLAGPIVNALDYHWLFWFPAIATAAAALATYVVVPESQVRTLGRVNWRATALLTTWLTALLLGVSKAPDWGWASTSVLSLVAVALVLAPSWIAFEARSSNPLIDMRMMRLPAVWSTNLVGFLSGVSLFVTSAFIPVFVQTPASAGYGFGSSVTQSGLVLLPNACAMFIFGSLSGGLSKRFSARRVLLVGSVMSVPPFVVLAFEHSHIWQIVMAGALLGAGFGLAFSAMSYIIVDAVPASQTGVASGMNSNIRTLGGSIGTAVVASIVASSGHHGGVPAEAGFTAAFAVLAGVAACGVLACLLIPRMRTAPTMERAEQAARSHPETAFIAD
jgi:EmrB/QacA subfamily drug resistance transporter